MKSRIYISAVFLFLSLLLSSLFSFAQTQKINTIHPSIFRSHDKQFERFLRKQMPFWKNVLDSVNTYRLQIYLTQIDTTKKGVVKYTYYQYPSKPSQYTYPASIIKLPMAIYFLQKLDDINRFQPTNPITLNDRIFIDDTAYCGQLGSNGIVNGMPIGSLLQELLQKSNNTAFNPLYEVVRDCHVNFATDFDDVNIQTRFSTKCDSNDNKRHCAYHIENSRGEILFKEDALVKSPSVLLANDFAKAGISYLDYKDSLIHAPRSFVKSNYISLESAHQLMVRLFAYNEDESFLSHPFRDSLLRYMSEFPSVDTSREIYPTTFKYLLWGSDFLTRKYYKMGINLPEPKSKITIYNKVGQAYGFLSDVAYFESIDKKTKFVLSASIFVDRDGVLNDGKYAYDEIGFPFLCNLGLVVANAEYKRKHH